MQPQNKPTTIVIFGVTGDLAAKKLIPSLFDLFMNKRLPEKTTIFGFGRRELTDEDLRVYMRKILQKDGYTCADESHPFFSQSLYFKGDLLDKESYKKLADYLYWVDERNGTCANKIFYLAIPPDMYEPVFKNLSHSGLTTPCANADENKDSWTRVLVEKPFGKDDKEAKKLDGLLGSLFDESQIFRIDHYLAKETVQNILAFRFANAIFAPIWNKDYIEKVHISISESIGVGERGDTYDIMGALRDVGQNHILQMLALIAMEDPGELKPQWLREERARVLRSLKIPKIDKENIVRGQYEGFKETELVNPNSETETYFRIITHIDNERWQGVPFILENGKCLDEKKTEITIYFKVTGSCLCPVGDEEHQNVLRFRIQPNEEISIRFWGKKTGFTFDLEPKELSYPYSFGDEGAPESYQRVLFDCLHGDQSLFASTDEVKAQWDFIMPIIEKWKDIPLKIYKKGSKSEDISSQ